MSKNISLFTVREDVTCIKCGNKGAVQFYGKYFPRGIGNEANRSKYLEEYRNKPYMSHAIGFGGTIPHKCMNCGNTGLIDFGGLEGYKMAFKTLEKSTKE